MGSDSSVITVTCDCGREMRVSRLLMGSKVKCVLCGADIQLPADPAAGVGPPCPHCGRPWPVGESRCPSCLARSRTRQSRRDEQEESSAFSRRFPAPETPGPEYEPPRPMDPATVRVKHWYDKPTTAGWPLAAGFVALGALAALAYGLGAEGDRGWAIAGGVAAAVSLGLLRSKATARSFMIGGPIVASLIGAGLILWLSPDEMTGTDVAICLGSVGLTVAGLAMMTRKHGQVGVVGLGGVLTFVGFVAVWITAADAGPGRAQRAEIVRKLGAELSKAREVISSTRPAPDASVRGESDRSPAGRAPPDVRLGPDLPANTGVDPPPVWADEVEPPKPPDAPAATQPTTPPAPAPAPPATAPALGAWPEAMAAQGVTVTFAAGEAVEMSRRTVSLEGRDRTETVYRTDSPDLDCQAVVYEGVVPAAEDPDHAELGRLARYVAGRMPGEIEYQIWRRGKGPRVYFIRARHVEDSFQWFTRIEARRVGSRVLVLVGSYNRHRPRAAGGSKAFFDSLVVTTEDESAGVGKD